MFGTLAIILVFGGLIFFHELGHFSAARMFGMGVKTFSLGFGPTLCSFTPHKTKYQLALLPLGGYVSLVGETDASDLPEGFTEKDSFSLRPAWQRFIVIAAGPFFNLLLAWMLCWGLLYFQGEKFMLPVVGEIAESSNARAAGLAPSDIIDSVNGVPIRDWRQILPVVQASEGKPVEVGIKRAGSSMTFMVTPVQQALPDNQGTSWLLGISHSGEMQTKYFSVLSAATSAVDKLGEYIILMWEGIVGLFSKTVSADQLMGPIGIGEVIYKTSAHGVGTVVGIAILISLNLGLINLIPIPVLDGGHLVFLTVEMITRREVPNSFKNGAAFVGLALLLGLMVFATYNDMVRLLFS